MSSYTAWKVSKYGVFSGTEFSGFELNTQRYGEIRSISPYSVRMRKNTGQKKLHISILFTQCQFSSKLQIENRWEMAGNFITSMSSALKIYHSCLPYWIMFFHALSYFRNSDDDTFYENVLIFRLHIPTTIYMIL